jgi:hypothetical protein
VLRRAVFETGSSVPFAVTTVLLEVPVSRKPHLEFTKVLHCKRAVSKLLVK